MSKGMKAIVLALIGLVLWMIFVYLTFAFIKAEANPFLWKEELRITFCFFSCICLPFLPLIVYEVKHS
jgi:hypothetical protein